MSSAGRIKMIGRAETNYHQKLTLNFHSYCLSPLGQMAACYFKPICIGVNIPPSSSTPRIRNYFIEIADDTLGFTKEIKQISQELRVTKSLKNDRMIFSLVLYFELALALSVAHLKYDSDDKNTKQKPNVFLITFAFTTFK